MSPVLHLLAGPNGAGKSTLVTEVLQPVTGLPFVNADEIAARRWPDDQAAHAYDASRAAADERVRLLGEGRSFITETVFSHASKVELVVDAAQRGYLVQLHVVMVPLGLSLCRVEERVARGGHDVPADKVRQRYARLWPLVAAAREVADSTRFYDNAAARSPFRRVADFQRGRPVGTPAWPAWTPDVLR